MVAQRRNGLFKHLSPMTWPEATGEEPQFFSLRQMVSQRCRTGRTATCHCFMPWGIRHHRSSVTTRRISNRMSKSSLQVANCFGGPQTSKMNSNE